MLMRAVCTAGIGAPQAEERLRVEEAQKHALTSTSLGADFLIPKVC